MPDYPQSLAPVNHIEPVPRRGSARRHGLRVGELARPGVAHVYGEDALEGLAGTVRFEWDALDDLTLDGESLERPTTHFS